MATTIPTTSTGETGPTSAMETATATAGSITRAIAGPCRITIALRRKNTAGRRVIPPERRSGATGGDRRGTPVRRIADRTTGDLRRRLATRAGTGDRAASEATRTGWVIEVSARITAGKAG